MIIAAECVILCFLFFIPVYFMSCDPVKTLYNYPPAIQERVKSLDEYKDKIPTKNNKIAVKITALIVFVIVISLILRFINGYTDFLRAFGIGFLIWTVVNLFDVIVLDIIWFCHDKRFVLKGTEDMTAEYHNYGFHIKGFFIGELLALIVCALAGLVVKFIL